MQIMRASVQALDRVHSFEIDASGVDTNGRRLSLSGVFIVSSGPDKGLSLIMADGPAAASFRVVGGYEYIVANTQFWTDSHLTAQAARRVAGRWLRVPAARLPGFASLRDELNPASAGRCILGTDGVIPTLGGRAQVNGEQVVVLKDDGQHNGAPGKVYVSASGAPLPVLLTQTGPQSTTAPPDRACGDTTNSPQGNGFFGTTNTMTMRFGQYDQVTSITPPPGQFTSLGGPQGA
jgi:hypothetical protein